MRDHLLQSGPAPIRDWVNSPHEAAFGPITDLITEPVFGLIVGGGVLFTMYIAGRGDLAAPTVLLFLISGILFTTLPGGYVTIATTIAVLGLVAAIMNVARRYVIT